MTTLKDRSIDNCRFSATDSSGRYEVRPERYNSDCWTGTKKILLTGASGFLGHLVKAKLENDGHEVWGLDLQECLPERIIGADLCDEQSVASALESIPPCDFIVHTAALAHGQNLKSGETYAGVNSSMTRNLIRALPWDIPPIIFFSSVAVYGEANRFQPVAPDAELSPSTDYGVGKKDCEAFLKESADTVLALRLSPVYDDSHLKDVRKRVFFPVLPMKMRIIPNPSYSLTHSSVVADEVARLASRDSFPPGFHVVNLADELPHSQEELRKRFPGPTLPVPLMLIRPFLFLFKLLPRKIGCKFQCLFHKLFFSNVYKGHSKNYPATESRTT